MKATWRWFGPEDPVSLNEIVQAGAEGIVSALHHLPNGAAWPVEEISKRKSEIAKAGLAWDIVESVPVHESIKRGSSSRDRYIQNYITTLNHLASGGIHHVVYNFMALTDWTRTDLAYRDSDSALTIRYDAIDIALFDMFILNRENAEKDYPEVIQKEAGKRYSEVDEITTSELIRTILMGLPGTVEDLDMDEFRENLAFYHDLGKSGLRKNLVYFLDHVIPEAEKLGITLSIHADDPPFPIFGLPRVMSTEEDLTFLTDYNTSSSNAICFCTGTFGASLANDIPGMIRKFAPRISFAHLRNVQHEPDGSFYESKVFEGTLDMREIGKILIAEQMKREEPIPFRPDHGQAIYNDKEMKTYPGYPAIGRMKSLAELRGLFVGLGDK